MLAVVYPINSKSSTQSQQQQDDPTAEYGVNANWEMSSNKKESIKHRLVDAGLCENKEIESILEEASKVGGRFFDIAVRDSVVPLKKWSSASGRVILLGDSAHAM